MMSILTLKSEIYFRFFSKLEPSMEPSILKFFCQNLFQIVKFEISNFHQKNLKMKIQQNSNFTRGEPDVVVDWEAASKALSAAKWGSPVQSEDELKNKIIEIMPKSRSNQLQNQNTLCFC